MTQALIDALAFRPDWQEKLRHAIIPENDYLHQFMLVFFSLSRPNFLTDASYQKLIKLSYDNLLHYLDNSSSAEKAIKELLEAVDDVLTLLNRSPLHPQSKKFKAALQEFCESLLIIESPNVSRRYRQDPLL